MADPRHGKREQTDDSLRAERHKTDEEIARGRLSVEESADRAVGEARKRADAVVSASRDASDRSTESSAEERNLIAEERTRDDRALAAERDSVDRQLAVERSAYQRVVATLLAAERDQTDASLVGEREHADGALRSRDDFLGMVSHDLRSLLSGISLNAAMLAHDLTSDEASERVTQRGHAIERSVTQMTRLVQDLIDVASIEAGRLGVDPIPHEAAVLVRDTIDAFEPVASTRGIAIATNVANDALLATFDHDRILQVLANLMSNAIRFTADGGRIEISVQPVDNEVQFSVIDTGTGIARDDLTAIFDRFWQAPSTKRRGLGLGLYISRCIVEAHGGKIWAESEPGRGARISFTLPGADSGRQTREPKT